MERIRKPAAVTLLIVICATVCLADQLQWTNRETSERAAQQIQQAPLIISFCSLCSEASIALWWVRGVEIRPVPADELFEIVIFGWKIDTARGIAQWSAEAVDLAYLYAPSGKTSFACLGLTLGLECITRAPLLHVPTRLAAVIAPSKSPTTGPALR